MSIIEKALDKLDGDIVSRKGSAEKNKLKQNITKNDKNTSVSGNTKEKVSKLINIDLEKLTSLGYLTPQADNKMLFEQYRRIKMPILQKAIEAVNNDRKNIIMVTSSLEGEGKSFTSINLAMSIAYEYNYTVLLIDADVTKKMVSSVFGVKKEEGLVDYLNGNSADLSELILKTNIPKLNVLPSGSSSEHVTELYNSNKMDDLAKELSCRYNDRVIIFDTPPILQDSSSEAIKNIIHQVLFVVEAEKTPQHIVKKALEVISDVGDVGLVLNKSNQRTSPSYYYNY